MKKLLKNTAVLSILSVFLITLIIPVFAHNGGTDENGGHYDRDTGEYHYHHGYSAHQHENGECPYDFHDNVDHQSGSSSNSSSYKPSEPTTREQTTKIDNYNSSFHETTVPLILGLVFGFLFSLFVSWVVFSFISPIIRDKTKHKKSTKVSIEAHEPERIVLPVKQPNNEITEQSIANSIPQHNNTSSAQKENTPQKQQTKCKTKSYEIKRDKIFDELVLFSLSDLVGNLPVNIELNRDLELIYKNEKSYEKYTVFVEPKSFVIHRKCDCGPTKKQKKLSLEFSIDSKYLLCSDCWTEKQKTGSINLFMPPWYSKYKTFRKPLEKYEFSIKKLMVRKQLNLYQQFTASEHKKWKTEVHTDFSQMKKIYKAKSVTILSYDNETKKAKIQGSKGEIYTTTFTSCSCKDFSLHHLPCKHIYKYFAEYGGIDFSKYI